MTPYLLIALAAFIVGRLTKRSQKPVRLPSSAYFMKRKEAWPVMQRWDSDAVQTLRRK